MSALTVNETERLQTEDFLEVSEFIQEHYGIQLPLTKKKMVEARLQKRLKALGLASFKEYFAFVFGEQGQPEYIQMIDLITTNKTDFFRESTHFDHLTEVVLPALVRSRPATEPLKIWSAASSTGEEIYSILITLEEFFFRAGRPHAYRILGTDLSTQVLKKAVTAVYDEERIDVLPLNIRKRYFLRNNDRENPKVRVKPALLRHVEFKRMNLLKPFAGVEPAYDIIFCRNVLIYFNRAVQQDVMTRLVERLKPGGYIFIGHSESLTNMRLPLVQVRPTMYKKTGS